MGWIVIWVLCGAVAALIANSRGASGCLGFVLGVALGPFGIIIACFLGGEKDQSARLLASGQRKKCPRCAELVQPEALVCRHCGHEFEQDA